MSNCARHFLFDWQEESRGKGKHDEPHRHDGFEAVLAECLLTDLEKHVGRHPCDKQADANRHGALR